MKELREMSVLVVGLGQIGGSIATSLQHAHAVARVIGYDSDRRVLRKAKQAGIINIAVPSLQQGIADADMIILAAPIRMILRILPAVLASLCPDQMCVDVASTKQQVLKIANKSGVTNFIGGHPIAGTEKQGLAGAAADLFIGKKFVLTPAKRTSRQAVSRARELVQAIGAQPLILSAQEHDRLLAHTSHLPYALALALLHTAQNVAKQDARLWSLTGGSFRSATRVAQSSPALTSDMLMTNARDTQLAITACITQLRAIKRFLREGDSRKLETYVQRAHHRAVRLNNSLIRGRKP